MSLFLNPLLRRTLTQAAGSAAAGKIVSKLSQQASDLAGGGAPSVEERTRFLVWLRGDFRRRQPDAFAQIWAEIQRRERWRESDGAFGEDDLAVALAALTSMWLQLQSVEDPAGAAATTACEEWFRELGEADAEDFATLIEAARPRPSEMQQRAASLLNAATEKAKDFDPTTERGQQRAAERADKVRSLGKSLNQSLFGRRAKR